MSSGQQGTSIARTQQRRRARHPCRKTRVGVVPASCRCGFLAVGFLRHRRCSRSRAFRLRIAPARAPRGIACAGAAAEAQKGHLQGAAAESQKGNVQGTAAQQKQEKEQTGGGQARAWGRLSRRVAAPRARAHICSRARAWHNQHSSANCIATFCVPAPRAMHSSWLHAIVRSRAHPTAACAAATRAFVCWLALAALLML
jgi:hypothetical protein